MTLKGRFLLQLSELLLECVCQQKDKIILSLTSILSAKVKAECSRP